MRATLALVLLTAALLAPPAVAGPAEPDFMFSGPPMVSPPAPQVGQSIVFSFRVANMGASSTTSGVINLYFDGSATPSLSAALPAMTGGQSLQMFVASTATPGAHSVRIVLNDGQIVPETIVSNNEATVTYTASQSDIAVRQLTVEHATTGVRTDLGAVPNPVGLRSVRVEVCNVGNAPLAGGELDVDVSASSSGSETIALNAPVPALAAQACTTLEYAWDPRLSFGDMEFRAHVSGGDNRDTANDDAFVADFVLVGGLGSGVIARPTIVL